MIKSARYIITILVIAVSILFSCTARNGDVRISSGSRTNAAEALLAGNDIYQGAVVFLSGEVTLVRQGNESMMTIGDTVIAGDTVKTAKAGYCEIQFGETAVIRLNENTTYLIEVLDRTDSDTNTGSRLIKGSILCKVNKLTDKSRFHIRTSDAICGVRGTQFLVEADKDKTRFAVNEGKVFVLPAVFDLTERKAPEAKQAEKLIIQEAPLIEEGQQILINNNDYIEKSETLELILTAFGEPDIHEDSPEYIRLRDFTREQAAGILSRKELVTPIDPDTKSKMTPLQDMKVLPLTPDKTGEKPLILIQINTEPSDSNIALNGVASGAGSLSGFWTAGDKITISVRKDGFTEKVVDYQATDKPEQVLNISLGKAPLKQSDETEQKKVSAPLVKAEALKVIINTEPGNATVTVNEKTVTGEFTNEYASDVTLTISAVKPGYSPEKMTLKASEAQNLVIRLKPQPIMANIGLSSEALSGSIINPSGGVILNDRKGKLYSISPEGNLVWSKQTENTVTENSQPVIYGNKVYLSGDRQVSSINIKNGNITGVFPFSSEDNHLFGKRVFGSASGLWVPLKDKILLLDPESLSKIKELPLQTENRMTPVVWKDMLYVLDISGNLLKIDNSNGKQLVSLPTGARDSVAMAPFIQDGQAFFTGRKGNLVCIDLEKDTVLWDVGLPSDTQIFTDITGEGNLLALFTGKSILVYNKKSGALVYSIKDATCPPLVKKGKLYFGTSEGYLVISELSSGKEDKRLNVKEVLSTRPVFDFGVLFAGTESGKILLIIPEAIP